MHTFSMCLALVSWSNCRFWSGLFSFPVGSCKVSGDQHPVWPVMQLCLPFVRTKLVCVPIHSWFWGLQPFLTTQGTKFSLNTELPELGVFLSTTKGHGYNEHMYSKIAVWSPLSICNLYNVIYLILGDTKNNQVRPYKGLLVPTDCEKSLKSLTWIFPQAQELALNWNIKYNKPFHGEVSLFHKGMDLPHALCQMSKAHVDVSYILGYLRIH